MGRRYISMALTDHYHDSGERTPEHARFRNVSEKKEDLS